LRNRNAQRVLFGRAEGKGPPWKPGRIKEDDTVLKQMLKYRVEEHGLKSLGSRRGQVAEFCKQCNKFGCHKVKVIS